KPMTIDAIADQVFGQGGSFTTSICNKMALSSSSLCYPFDVAVDPGDNVYVSDGGNSRVLWYQSPTMLGVTADLAFGQGGSFSTNTCNLGGPNARSLCVPRGLAVSSSGRLYIADAHNHRVLAYDNPPSLDTTADQVFG